MIVALTMLFDTSPLRHRCFALGIGTGLAALSYEVLEMPIRRSRGLDAFPWPTAVAGVGISALVAVTLVPTMLELDRKPAFAESSHGAGGAALSCRRGTEPIPQGIDWEAVRSDRRGALVRRRRAGSVHGPRRAAARTSCSSATARRVAFVPMFRSWPRNTT